MWPVGPGTSSSHIDLVFIRESVAGVRHGLRGFFPGWERLARGLFFL